MDAIKIFSVNFFEKKCAFLYNKLLNGTIFAERERERDNHRYITCRVLVCAYINRYSRNIVFIQCCGFFVSSLYYCLKTNLYKFY